MCGSEGIGPPSWRRSSPSGVAGPGEQQPADELARRGRVDGDHTAAQRRVPRQRERQRRPVVLDPRTQIGQAPTGSPASAGRTPARRRRRQPGRRPARRPAARSASRCRPGRSRSGRRRGRSTGGVTRHWSPFSVISTPRPRSASRISAVSRASRPPVITDGPSASAARISARLVSDFDPGTATVAVIGASAVGAGQGLRDDVGDTGLSLRVDAGRAGPNPARLVLDVSCCRARCSCRPSWLPSWPP